MLQFVHLRKELVLRIADPSTLQACGQDTHKGMMGGHVRLLPRFVFNEEKNRLSRIGFVPIARRIAGQDPTVGRLNPPPCRWMMCSPLEVPILA